MAEKWSSAKFLAEAEAIRASAGASKFPKVKALQRYAKTTARKADQTK